MNHYFSVETACAYGVTEAVLLNHFAYWIARNRETGSCLREGRTWTVCTQREIAESFPYLTKAQIRHALKHLRQQGVLLTANYNRSRYNRTLWYAIADSCAIKEPEREIEGCKPANQSLPGEKSIQDNKKDNIRDDEGDRESTRARWQPPEKEAIKDYCIQRGSGIDPEAFYDYYAARGWSYGPGKPMKDWKAAVRSWERREKNRPEQKPARSAEEIYDDIFAGRI